jgi:hypothetical protein
MQAEKIKKCEIDNNISVLVTARPRFAPREQIGYCANGTNKLLKKGSDPLVLLRINSRRNEADLAGRGSDPFSAACQCKARGYEL